MDLSLAVHQYLAARPDQYLDDSSRAGRVSRRDLITAAALAGEWRRDGPRYTAAILYALHGSYQMSINALADLTSIPATTVARLIEQAREEVASGE